MRNIPPPKRRFKRSHLVLGTLVIVALGIGFVSSFENGQLDWRGFGSNLSTELLGAVITYLIINRLIEDSEDNNQLKSRLIRDMENPDNGNTYSAIQELRSRGWLQGGALFGWFLQRTNLENAPLEGADLRGFGLYKSNLKNAQVEISQLVHMNDLRLTVMPDGSLYDGRYCLRGDIDWALSRYDIDIVTASNEVMADYYGVSLEAYQQGKTWAIENLPKLGIPLPEHLIKID